MTIKQVEQLRSGSTIFDSDGCSYEVQYWNHEEELLVKHVCDYRLERIPLELLLTDKWLFTLNSPPDLTRLQL